MTNENTETTGAVERAAEAILEACYGQELPEAPIDLAREALAAVLPDIQAQAFEAAAVRVRADFAAHGKQCPWVGFLDDEAARLRAARLTDTPTTMEEEEL